MFSINGQPDGRFLCAERIKLYFLGLRMHIRVRTPFYFSSMNIQQLRQGCKWILWCFCVAAWTYERCWRSTARTSACTSKRCAPTRSNCCWPSSWWSGAASSTPTSSPTTSWWVHAALSHMLSASFFLFFSISLSLMGNSGHLTWVWHSSCKSSATHSCVSKQWYGCLCLGFLTCEQMLMHVIVHGGCTDTVRESALEADWEKNPLLHLGLKPASVSHLAFQLDTLPSELCPPQLQGYSMACMVFVQCTALACVLVTLVSECTSQAGLHSLIVGLSVVSSQCFSCPSDQDSHEIYMASAAHRLLISSQYFLLVCQIGIHTKYIWPQLLIDSWSVLSIFY